MNSIKIPENQRTSGKHLASNKKVHVTFPEFYKQLYNKQLYQQTS